MRFSGKLGKSCSEMEHSNGTQPGGWLPASTINDLEVEWSLLKFIECCRTEDCARCNIIYHFAYAECRVVCVCVR